ncbi:MAG: glycosyltransferase, partial [Acidobacteria bacterium]|nr:glycosyltransferase [Acidobacteriota bacterium]
ISFIASTNWGVDRLRESSLFRNNRVELIPFPIDTTVFRPIDRRIARDLLQIPFDKKVIFFGATYLDDRRKGMKQLVEALAKLAEMVETSDEINREEIFLFVAGLNGKELMAKLPFAAKYAGLLNNDLTLALAYQAADIFISASVEENGPMMIPEAMLCETPVVAFNTGGAPDLIETMRNGYLARYADATDLARGIYNLLTSPSLPAMRVAARESAERLHTPSIVAQRHIDLYQSLFQSVAVESLGVQASCLQAAS